MDRGQGIELVEYVGNLCQLKCIENTRNPKAEGRLVTFYFSSGRNIPAFELVKREAERMVERFNRAYESVWVPVWGEIFSEEDLPF